MVEGRKHGLIISGEEGMGWFDVGVEVRPMVYCVSAYGYFVPTPIVRFICMHAAWIG